MCSGVQIYRRALRFFPPPMDIPPPDDLGGGSSHSFTGFAAPGGAGRYLESARPFPGRPQFALAASARAPAPPAGGLALRPRRLGARLRRNRSRSALFCDSISASPFSSRGLNLPRRPRRPESAASTTTRAARRRRRRSRTGGRASAVAEAERRPAGRGRGGGRRHGGCGSGSGRRLGLPLRRQSLRRLDTRLARPPPPWPCASA